MNYYAQIDGGKVVAVTASSAAIVAAAMVELTGYDTSKIGCAYSNGVFTAPPATPVLRHIAVGSFFDRFGAFKYPILASTDAGVKALILDCSVRGYIDLDNPQLPGGLAVIVAAGFAIDPAAIVNAPVLDSERP